MDKKRFILQPSEQPLHWVCTDTDNNIVCRFEEHKFNETQKFTLIDGESFRTKEAALAVATYIREMGDWLYANHKDKVF